MTNDFTRATSTELHQRRDLVLCKQCGRWTRNLHIRCNAGLGGRVPCKLGGFASEGRRECSSFWVLFPAGLESLLSWSTVTADRIDRAGLSYSLSSGDRHSATALNVREGLIDVYHQVNDCAIKAYRILSDEVIFSFMKDRKHEMLAKNCMTTFELCSSERKHW